MKIEGGVLILPDVLSHTDHAEALLRDSAYPKAKADQDSACSAESKVKSQGGSLEELIEPSHQCDYCKSGNDNKERRVRDSGRF